APGGAYTAASSSTRQCARPATATASSASAIMTAPYAGQARVTARNRLAAAATVRVGRATDPLEKDRGGNSAGPGARGRSARSVDELVELVDESRPWPEVEAAYRRLCNAALGSGAAGGRARGAGPASAGGGAGGRGSLVPGAPAPPGQRRARGLTRP